MVIEEMADGPTAATEYPMVLAVGTRAWWRTASVSTNPDIATLACQEQCSSEGGSGGVGTCCWQPDDTDFIVRAERDRS